MQVTLTSAKCRQRVVACINAALFFRKWKMCNAKCANIILESRGEMHGSVNKFDMQLRGTAPHAPDLSYFACFSVTEKKNILFMHGADRNVIQSQKE